MSKLILIGGPPRCGKTTLAQDISKKLGIPWISTDALESIAQQYTSEDERDILFPKTLIRHKTNRGNDEMYETFSTEEIVDAYRKQAETIHKAIETFVNYAEKEDWDYIIEGYHITPKLLLELQSNGLKFSSIMLINTNSKEAIKMSKESDVKNDWVRDKTQKQETFSKIADMINFYSNKLKEEAKDSDIKIIDMRENFQENYIEAFKFFVN